MIHPENGYELVGSLVESKGQGGLQVRSGVKIGMINPEKGY